jgi:hypothetical protein
MRNYETKTFDYIDKKTGAHIVKAETMYAGKPVSAFAKCDPNDTFSLAFGKEVALRRLDYKIAKKRQASMLAYAKMCKQNLEWIEIEKRRVKAALERAEVAALDRKVEANEIAVEIAKMLSDLG